MKKQNDPAELLRSIGCRVTEGRVALIAMLQSARKPLTAKEILESLKGVLDQATLYRALETLDASGLVRKMHMASDDAFYYELALGHHHHIVCAMCGHVEDFSEAACDSIMRSALKFTKDFARLDAHTIELSGVCKKCSK